MYKEELYDRGSLNSAMDALDRLEKEYDVRKLWRTERNGPATVAITGKAERQNAYWIIEEK